MNKITIKDNTFKTKKFSVLIDGHSREERFSTEKQAHNFARNSHQFQQGFSISNCVVSKPREVKVTRWQ